MTMTGWMWARSLRFGLTLWYVGAMVVVLGVYAAGVFAFVQRSVSQGLDTSLRNDFSWAAEMWEQRPDGSLAWFDTGAGSEDDPWLQVWSASGEVLFRTAVAARNPLPAARTLALRRDGRIALVEARGYGYRVLSRAATVGGTEVVIQVARSEAPAREELWQLTMFLALGLPFGVAAAGLGGYVLARRALVPIERMTEQARSITAARLSDRLPVRRADDELGRLAVVFNDTLERLERSFAEMQRFTGDVSHELRTPLTAMRMVGEVGLREARDADACRAVIGSILEEADRLTSLVERLLALSRATSATTPLRVEAVDLGDLAREVASHLAVLADEKSQSIDVARSGAPVARADRVTLRQALINVLDNAIKYSPPGSRIEVRASATAMGAVLEVCDRGPGIPAERRGRIFDRFYRASPDGHADGAGLGLSIAKWAIEASHGELACESRQGGGSTFRIVLPQEPVPRYRDAGWASVSSWNELSPSRNS